MPQGKKPATKSAKRKKVHKVMDEYKHGELKSGRGGKGGKVKSRKQAIAIALSESGQSNKRKGKTSTAKKTAKKKTAKKKPGPKKKTARKKSSSKKSS